MRGYRREEANKNILTILELFLRLRHSKHRCKFDLQNSLTNNKVNSDHIIDKNIRIE